MRSVLLSIAASRARRHGVDARSDLRAPRPIYIEDAKSSRTSRLEPRLGNDQEAHQVHPRKARGGRVRKGLRSRNRPATTEHILPESPLDGWAELIPREKWSESVYRLGNLALLEASLNREIANAAYPTKAAAYARSSYVTTQRIAETAPNGWSLALIEDRQRALARRAVHVWRSDFA
jgi:hypothetical protein